MKNLSIALNAVLFVLVGVLFYLHFSSKNKSGATPQIIQTNGKNVPKVKNSSTPELINAPQSHSSATETPALAHPHI